MDRSAVTSRAEIDDRPVKCQVGGNEKSCAESVPAEMIRDSIVRILQTDLLSEMRSGR